MVSAASDSGELDSDRAAITAEGQRATVSAAVSLPEYREPQSQQVRNLVSIYGALIRREGPLSRLDIEPYFIPAPSSERNQGFYADLGRWWSARDREDLLALPGIEETKGDLRFVSVSPNESGLPDGVDAEYLRPLAEFRADPRVRTTIELDDRYGPEFDEREAVLDLWDRVAASSPITSEEIKRDQRLDLDGYADVLDARGAALAGAASGGDGRLSGAASRYRAERANHSSELPPRSLQPPVDDPPAGEEELSARAPINGYGSNCCTLGLRGQVRPRGDYGDRIIGNR